MPQLNNTEPLRLRVATGNEGPIVTCRCAGDVSSAQFVYCAVARADRPPNPDVCLPPEQPRRDGVRLAANHAEMTWRVNLVSDFVEGLAVWVWVERNPYPAIVTIDVGFDGTPKEPQPRSAPDGKSR